MPKRLTFTEERLLESLSFTTAFSLEQIKLIYQKVNSIDKIIVILNLIGSGLSMTDAINTTRPVVVHTHSPAPWIEDKESILHLNDANGKCVGLFVRRADMKACEMTPDLIQVAKMYFDYMKSNNQTNTLPFMVVSKILNNLNQ
jgi:hypothetical protein